MSFFKGLFSRRVLSPQTMAASLLLGGALALNANNDRNFKYRQFIQAYLQSPIYQ